MRTCRTRERFGGGMKPFPQNGPSGVLGPSARPGPNASPIKGAANGTVAGDFGRSNAANEQRGVAADRARNGFAVSRNPHLIGV